jgi:uncharacterized protein (DUF885 family)
LLWSGSVPLPVLRQKIEAWVGAQLDHEGD